MPVACSWGPILPDCGGAQPRGIRFTGSGPRAFDRGPTANQSGEEACRVVCSLRRGRSGDGKDAPALLDRPGVLEVGLGVPILVVLAVVIFTAGGSPPPPADPTAAKPTATASIGSVPDPDPTVGGEVDEGLEAERANAPTAQQLQRRLKRRGLVLVDGPPPAMDLFFKVASFNILGASHTRGPNRRKRFAGAEARMPGQIQMLESKGVTVAGLQEFQAPQVNSFLARVGSRLGRILPGHQPRRPARRQLHHLAQRPVGGGEDADHPGAVLPWPAGPDAAGPPASPH